jgi:hypothetical protein
MDNILKKLINTFLREHFSFLIFVKLLTNKKAGGKTSGFLA